MVPPSGILSTIRVNKTDLEANEKAGVFDQEKNHTNNKSMESRLGRQIEQPLNLAQQYDFGQYFPYLIFSFSIC